MKKRVKKPRLVDVSSDKIQTGSNYRKFKKEDLGDLLESVKRRGLLQPVILTRNEDPKTKKKKPYELVAGERRFCCCDILRRDVRGVLYENLTEERFLAIQLAENSKRHINPGELAESAFDLYKELIAEKLGLDPRKLDRYNPDNLPEKYKRELSINDTAALIGRGESTTRDYFAFMKLDKRVRNMVIKGQLDFGKAVVLSRLPKDSQLSTAVNFHGSKKELELMLKDKEEKNTDFSLNGDMRTRPYNAMAKHLDIISKVVKASVEHFRYPSNRMDGELTSVVDEGLRVLYDIRDVIEQEASAKGRLEKMLSMVDGKKSSAYKKFVLGTKFDLTGEVSGDFGEELKMISVRLLDEDKEQPRKTYDPVGIKELEDSISEVGQIEPLLVSPVGRRFIVVDGNRRRRALANIGEKEALCVVAHMNRVQRRVCQFEAEFHQEDRPDERAETIYRWADLKKRQSKTDMSQRQVADQLGYSRSTVKTALDFASLSDNVKKMHRQGLLTYGAASELSKVPKDMQRKLAFQIYLRGRSAKAAKEAVRAYEEDRDVPMLFGEDAGRTGFGPLLLNDLQKHLHASSLRTLENGDTYKSSFVTGFYSLIRDLEKLRSYCKNG